MRGEGGREKRVDERGGWKRGEGEKEGRVRVSTVYAGLFWRKRGTAKNQGMGAGMRRTHSASFCVNDVKSARSERATRIRPLISRLHACHAGGWPTWTVLTGNP